jgi:hypothetical protein
MLNMQQQGSYHCHILRMLFSLWHWAEFQCNVPCNLLDLLLPVLSLAVFLRPQEHQVYPYAVSALVDQRITWRADGIPIIWSAH